MKIIVINLETQPQRWHATNTQLQALGLPALRLPAVPGRNLSAEQREGLYCPRLNRRQYHRRLQAGEIGCYASHILAWRHLVDSGDPCAAIFEDDVTVDAELPRVLAAIEHLPQPWDMVKLTGRVREKVRATRPLASRHRLIDYRRVPSLTGAYVLARGGAQKLLARHPPFGRPVDVDLRYWWECGLHILGVLPYPTSQARDQAGSAMEDRHAPGGLAGRMHKLRLQLGYTPRNWCAVQARASRQWRARLDGQALQHARTRP